MKCIGLAWTSPEIVIIDFDRTKYRTHILREPKLARADLERAIASEDLRRLVVLADGTGVLARVADLPVHAFLVFDTVTALRAIEGAVLLDQEEGRDDCAMKRIQMADVYAAVNGPVQPFKVPADLVQVSSALASKITLRELMDKVTRKAAVSDEFITKTCERIVGRIGKAAWVARVRKPALAAGMDSQALAEIERFVEDGSVSDGLWRGFFDHVELDVPLADVLKSYDVRQGDIEYLVERVGGKVGVDNYATSPQKTKKRRG